MLSGVTDWIQGKLSYAVNDSDIVKAVNNAYAAICYNKDKSSALTCKYKLDDVAHVVWAYINYFVTNPDQNAKYYYDEAPDRTDPYRKALVERIAQTVSKDADFTNDVLSYLYWAVKRDKAFRGILRPREVDKFKNPDYWYSGVFGGLFKISVETVRFAEETLKKVGYVVSKTTQGLTDLLETAGKTVSYLPWILGIGAVGFAGFQIYKYKKTGEIVKIGKRQNKMAKTELWSLQPSGHGHYKITIKFRNGKFYSTTTSDMQLVDEYRSGNERAMKSSRAKLIRIVKRDHSLDGQDNYTTRARTRKTLNDLDDLSGRKRKKKRKSKRSKRK